MVSSRNEGTIAALWRFPVKSMSGERLEESEVTANGVVGDRAYALIDTETGKVVSAKSVKLFPNVLACKASFVEPPTRSGPLPPIRIALPDGTTVRSDAGDVDTRLSTHFGRSVRLTHVSPAELTIDQYYADVEGASLDGKRDTVVSQKIGSALFAELGMPSPVPPGSFLDAFPLSLLTTSTLAQLNELRPQTAFDERRFRMNLIVSSERPGFVENDWIGRPVGVGERVRLMVAMADPRCVMTTLPQDELPQDVEVLRTLVRHNRLQVGELGKLPCAGVYAVITAPGTVRVGDRVVLN
ncbi:MAG TPA: MOSC N-terminal beta barrel domain-containing protein [Nevskiaceae bacterium]|nr:MOSC N-terminal beta barrel domain-containing protein [Nevskiaceae bacterium]